HRVRRQRLDHRAADCVCVKLHQKLIVRMPTSDVQGLDWRSSLLDRLDYVPHAECDRDRGAKVELAQTIETRLETQAAYDAERTRIGERRTVAVEIGQDVEPAREVGTLDPAHLFDARRDSGMGWGGRFG